MGSWFLLLVALIPQFFVFGAAHGVPHTCIHDELVRNSPPIEYVPQTFELPTKRATTETRFTQPLRIFLDTENLEDDSYTCYKAGDSCSYFNSEDACTCNAGDVLTPKKRELVNEFLQEAISFYSKSLTVIPLKDGLKPTTTLSAASSCDKIRISPKYLNGIDAEFLLFVTSRPIAGQAVIATARFCQVELINEAGGGTIPGRPIVGIMNIQPLHLIEGSQYKASQIGVFIHEMAHALGFTSAKFKAGFIRWDDDKPIPIPPKDIIHTYFHPQLQQQVSRIVTPSVVQAARKHFGCSTLDGAELENKGGSGTAGSHWSKRVFQNEFMTGIQSPFPVYSDITLALFKDMGWYGLGDHRSREPLLWGRHMGCNFANDSCATWPTNSQAEGYRCTSSDPRDQCSWDLRGWGTCTSEAPGPLDDPGCEYYAPNPNTYCDINTKLLRFDFSDGEKHFPSSRCFHSTLVAIPALSTFIYVPQAPYMRCYPTVCAGPTRLKVAVDEVWYDCPYEGGAIYPAEYGGQITCAKHAADLVCDPYLNQSHYPSWPSFAKVTPAIGKLGTTDQNGTEIVIEGMNFKDNSTVKIGGVPCPDVQVIDSFTIVASLPSIEQFTSLRALGGASSRLSIVITDDSGKTALGLDAFQLLVDIDGTDIALFFQRLGVPRAAFIFLAVFSVSLCLLSVVGWLSWRYYKGKSAQSLIYQPLEN